MKLVKILNVAVSKANSTGRLNRNAPCLLAFINFAKNKLILDEHLVFRRAVENMKNQDFSLKGNNDTLNTRDVPLREMTFKQDDVSEGNLDSENFFPLAC